jgi:hypothetical protein
MKLTFQFDSFSGPFGGVRLSVFVYPDVADVDLAPA